MSGTYKVKYHLEPEAGEFTKAQCEETGGGCDALVLVSMLFPDDGSYSQRVVSFDGRNGGDQISEEDLFKVWSLIAYELSQNDEFRKTSPGRHGVVAAVHATIKDAILSARYEGDK